MFKRIKRQLVVLAAFARVTDRLKLHSFALVKVCVVFPSSRFYAFLQLYFLTLEYGAVAFGVFAGSLSYFYSASHLYLSMPSIDRLCYKYQSSFKDRFALTLHARRAF